MKLKLLSHPTILYTLYAAVLTWPLVLHPLSLLASPQGPGDPYLNLWILGWDLRTLTTDPGALFTGRIFDANIFHPASGTLAYSDHLVLQAIALLPLYLVTHHLTLCYNVLLFGSLVGSALAMHRFVREVIGSEGGALVAGLIWGFCPFRFSHVIHLQLQALYLLPLAFLYVHRVIAAQRRADAVKLGIVAALQAASSVYYGVIGSVGLAIAAVSLAWVAGCWRRSVLHRRLVLAVGVGLLVVAPFIWPFYQVQRREGLVRNLFQASQNSARPVSYLRVNPFNAPYGWSGLLRAPQGASTGAAPEGHERELFPGFIAMVLAAFGGWTARRGESRAAAVSFAALLVTGVTLSFGPDGVRWIYSTFFDLVFGAQAIRAPARFAVLATFGLAGLASLGMRALAARPPTREALRRASPKPGEGGSAAKPTKGQPANGLGYRGQSRWLATVLPALIAALVALEYINTPLPYVPAPTLRTPVGEWLARAPGPGAVVYLPMGLDAENTPAMIESLEHGRPIVNGYSGHRPAYYPALVESFEDFPAPSALWTLHELGVRFIVTREPSRRVGSAPEPGAVSSPSPLVLRATFGGEDVYELVWTAEVDATLPRPSAPAPPPPGPAPFRIGEEALYRVAWVGSGAMNLAAGTIRLVVRDPGRVTGAVDAGAPAPRYVFEVSAETADWVSRFFQAQDRFASWADAELLSVRYEQHLREGRRVLDRMFEFDRARGLLRSFGADPDAPNNPALPIPPSTRDPVTTFFYARTLPLQPGYRVRIPVNDVGRNLIVDLQITEGTIDHDGRQTPALRIEPKLEYRIQRRSTPSVVVWMGRDERRIPLLITVDAAFGSFRAELVSYANPGASGTPGAR